MKSAFFTGRFRKLKLLTAWVQITPSAQNNLVGYWRLNEGTGTAFSDLSTSGNSGTITVAPWSAQVPFNPAPPTPTIAYILPNLVATSSANYQWYLNGNPISGATFQTYHPTQIGSYTVSVTALNGCTATSSAYVINVLGIEENVIDQLVSLLPNPAHDAIHIQLKKDHSITHIEISDITGRTLFFNSDVTSDDIRVPVNQYAAGIYLAKFYGTKGVLTKKFVVE
jgi:hypothetical protein